MLLRLATLGALGYAAFKYYENNREQVDGAIRRLSGAENDGAPQSENEEAVTLAGGPLSAEAHIVHRGDELA